MSNCRLFPVLILMLLSFQSSLKADEDLSNKEVQVGVILDMESWLGKVGYRCITMAASDFYAANPGYKTRIVFTTRDTKGEPLHAMSAALDLLENTEVQAIIGPESTEEAKFLEVLGDKVNIPILSSSTSPVSNQNPYIIQITQYETTQFKGISAMVESVKAKNVIVICEDTPNGREMATYMVSAFQEKNIHVSYTSRISTSFSKQEVKEELQKINTMPATVFVMHTPPSITANIFSMAKDLGMMGGGSMWVVTSKTTNFLNSMDVEAIELMQGAVGFRSFFPTSRKLQNLALESRKDHYALNPSIKFQELNYNSLWAYDAVNALAMAVERLQTTNLGTVGTSLLNQILRVNFHGLGGEFKIMNGTTISKPMEVVNVIGKGGKRVGFWTATGEFVKEIGKRNSSSNQGLETIIWPTATFSKRRMLQTNGKKLRIIVPNLFGTSPDILHVAVDPKTNLLGVSGYCGEVFNTAFNALDYGVGVEIIPYTYKDGRSYNDLIEKVYFKEYDAAVGDITITENRSLYVDFTLTFTDLGTGTLTHNSKKSIWIFLDPLSAELWITTASFFLLLGLVIWFIEHGTNEEFQGSAGKQIGTSLWFAFSTLVYAQREKLQSNLSRFVVTVWVFVVLVLTSSYTATLSSLLTVQQIGMNEMAIGFQGLSSIGGALYNNLDFAERKIEKLYTAEAYAEALTSGRFAAIVDEILYLKHFIAVYPTGFSLIATQSTTDGFSFAFPKGSPIAGEMSTQIAKMREDGTLKALENKWIKRRSTLMSKDVSSPSQKILQLYGLRGLFLISSVSMALAVFMYVARLSHEKWHVKFKTEILRFLLKRSFKIHAQDSDVDSTI